MFVCVVVVALVASLAAALVTGWQERRSNEGTMQQVQLRIQHEQFVTERRLQGLTQQTLQRLLNEARDAESGRGTDDVRYQP